VAPVATNRRHKFKSQTTSGFFLCPKKMEKGIRIVPMLDDDAELVGQGLRAYNLEQVLPTLPELWIHFNFVAKNNEGEVIGGIKAALGYWLALEIYTLWVHPDHRKHGTGCLLLEKAEKAAIEKGATLAIVDTFSFQAPEFYKKRGYEIFGELKDFPPGHTRYYLWKKL
jgi:ribosomal protein S18 acetylase RimI-like enzyme